MDATRIKAHFTEQISGARDRYLQDLEALDESVLRSSPGGTARTPYDFTYEVAYVNRRAAARMRGEDPGPFSSDGWMRAPEECQSKARIVQDLTESANEVLAAWEALPDTELDRKISVPNGETSPFDLASLCAMHMNYHDAQLNYLQSLMGDDEMHWGG